MKTDSITPEDQLLQQILIEIKKHENQQNQTIEMLNEFFDTATDLLDDDQ